MPATEPSATTPVGLTAAQLRRNVYDGFGTDGLLYVGTVSDTPGKIAGADNSIFVIQNNGVPIFVAPGNGNIPYVSAGVIGIWNLAAAVADASTGTSFPGSPQDWQTFTRTDLGATFQYDATRSKWLEVGSPCSFVTQRANWTLNQTGLVGNLGTGGTDGVPLGFDATVVGVALRAANAITATYQVRKVTSAGSVSNLSSVSISASRAQADMTLNNDVSNGDALFVVCTAGSVAGDVFATVYYRRRAS